MAHNKIEVMNQTSIPGPAGRVNCGIHTMKNSLLFLLFNKKIINNETFYKLVKSKEFFKHLDAAIKKAGILSNELTTVQFVRILEKVKTGGIDLSEYGISRENLKSLNLSIDGQQDISPFELAGYAGELCYGINGQGVNNLLNAAASARFMRLKGPATHVFAVGLTKIGPKNIGHWITAIVTKDTKGKYRWQFMDSWDNDTSFAPKVIKLIEKVLNKNESDLQTYLVEAYDAATDLLNRRYKMFFDTTTHTPIPNASIDPFGKTNYINAKQFYLEVNRAEYCYDLERLFTFMKTSGWLLSSGEAETTRKKQLYAIASYMLENALDEDIELKQILGPICEEVLASLSLDKNAKPVETKLDTPVDVDTSDKATELEMPTEDTGIKFTKTNYITELDSLQDRISDFEWRLNNALGNGESNNYKKLQLAYDAACRLQKKLIEESESYLKKPTVENYNHFKMRCEAHIKHARKELGQHRGWTEFLVNLALGIGTFGLGILVKGAINYANNRHFLFVCKTNSEKELDVIAECINKTVPAA